MNWTQQEKRPPTHTHHPRAKTEYLPKCYAAIYVGSEQTKRITNKRSLKGPKLPCENNNQKTTLPKQEETDPYQVLQYRHSDRGTQTLLYKSIYNSNEQTQTHTSAYTYWYQRPSKWQQSDPQVVYWVVAAWSMAVIWWLNTAWSANYPIAEQEWIPLNDSDSLDSSKTHPGVHTWEREEKKPTAILWWEESHKHTHTHTYMTYMILGHNNTLMTHYFLIWCMFHFIYSTLNFQTVVATVFSANVLGMTTPS